MGETLVSRRFEMNGRLHLVGLLLRNHKPPTKGAPPSMDETTIGRNFQRG